MTDSSNTPVRRQILAWLIGLVVAFILGYLLALRHPLPILVPLHPACLTPTQPVAPKAVADVGMHGGPTSGAPGTPTHFGAGDSSGTGKVIGNGAQARGSDAPASIRASGSGDGDVPGGCKSHVDGSVVANSSSSAAHGGGGEIDNGGGNGSGHSTPTPASTASDITLPATPTSGAWVPRPAGTVLTSGTQNSKPGVVASTPAGKVVTALDYRYDKSGLPHYPNAVKVGSGTDVAAAAAAAGPAMKNFSVTEIITDDTPAVAAAWYHDHLPAGWNELAMPSAPVMDQAIAQSKSPQPGESPVNGLINQMITGPQLEREKPGVDAARAAGLTIFQPPDQKVDHRMILVIKDNKTGKTAILLMKKNAP